VTFIFRLASRLKPVSFRLHRLAAVAVPVCSVALASGGVARAEIVYAVSFDDPASQFTNFYLPIETGIEAAGAAWSKYLAGSGSLSFLVRFADIPTSSGFSGTNSFVGTNGPFNVFEQGVASQLRTGVEPVGSPPDAILTFGRDYLANKLWFDPNPFTRQAPVPLDKTDAESVIIHEFAHILAFSGWRDPVTGALPGNYESTFDRYVVADKGRLYFTGPKAEQLYGGPVPLTTGNYEHFGNPPPGPGADLLDDLMNGVEFRDGQRYAISPLDLAVLDDSGVALTTDPASLLAPTSDIPEPSGLAAALAALLGLAVVRWLRLRFTSASPTA
jgi:hypothetical protein